MQCGQTTRRPADDLKIRNPKSQMDEWVGWCSNPRLQVFSLALNLLSYRPAEFNEKSPIRRRRTRLWGIPVELSAECHKRRGNTGSVFAGCSANRVPFPSDMRLDRKKVIERILALLELLAVCSTMFGGDFGPARELDVGSRAKVRSRSANFEN